MTRLVVTPNRIAKEFDTFFDNFFAPSCGPRSDGDYVPRVDVVESEDKLSLTFEVPGIAKDNLKVFVKDDVLTVSGERKVENETEQAKFVRREIRSGQFSRSFTLPDSVDPGSVSADYKHGLLTVSLAKREETKPKEIQVKVS